MFAKLRLLLVSVAFLAAGCATAPRTPQHLSPDFAAAGVTSVAVLPVTFDPRYEPPYDIDVAGELRRSLLEALRHKGYRADSFETAGMTDGRLEVHVDFLILDVQTLERNPPPSIEVEAVGRLLASADGRELWRDRGQARSSSTLIFYPAAERQMVLSLLAERLLATLPPAGSR